MTLIAGLIWAAILVALYGAIEFTIARCTRLAFLRGKRQGYEEAYVEVWDALTHGGRLSVSAPKGSGAEGTTITIEQLPGLGMGTLHSLSPDRMRAWTDVSTLN